MSDKLARAQHRRAPEQNGAHRANETQSAQPRTWEAGETGRIPIVGKHAGTDKTAESKASSVGASAALMSVCVLFSRVTGFLRTWAMAFALGSSFLSSSYQVANNLPNMLYELVMGGMLVTAFLPVYISVKKKSGTRAGNAYASNLLTLVTIFLGVLSVLCMVFPAQVIYTQTFYSDQSSSALATFFFQYFAIQLVFYGASSIVSGLLNANRDYLWSSIAPVANTLPYSFLAIPITTAMFTELSEMKAEGDMKGVVSAITNGTAQIMFLLIPFALYLAVFSVPLVTLYHVGAFTMENIQSISSYLVVLAFALPFYGVSSYLQKVFSSLRKMGVYAALNFLAGIVQVALTAFWAWTTYNGDPNPATIESIALASIAFYVVGDVAMFIYLRAHLGHVGVRKIFGASFAGLLLGGIGALCGFGILTALETFVSPLSGSLLQAFGYIVAGGLVSLIVTFGLAHKLHIPEASFITNIAGKVFRKLRRR